MQALDLFRGAGGWSVAAQRLGITDYGVEIMPEANATAELAGHKTAFENVWFPYEIEGRRFDGLIASPPCQTFSTAGGGKGREVLDDVLASIELGLWTDIEQLMDLAREMGDERTALVLTPMHYMWLTRPRWIAWEQVPTALPVWEACAQELRVQGYSTWTGILSAERYGVPQTRKRAILIASRDRVVGEPEATHSKYHTRDPERLDEGVLPWVSMAEALDWDDVGNIFQRSNYNGWVDGRRERTTRELDEPSTCITSKAFRWCAREDRGTSVATVAEAGVLQSFPSDYPWSVGKSRLQVGNAVPPLLAEAVLREATGLLDKRSDVRP